MKYAFITQHRKTWPVDPMCRVLGVKRNSYYRYCLRRQDKQVYALPQAVQGDNAQRPSTPAI